MFEDMVRVGVLGLRVWVRVWDLGLGVLLAITHSFSIIYFNGFIFKLGDSLF